MSVKRKLSKQEKYLRRVKELSKAQSSAKLGYKMAVPEAKGQEAKNNSFVQESSQQNPNNKYTLPIAQIKKDLWKNLFYAVFAVVLVAVLKITGAGFDQIKHLLSF